ncbi:hypothetical protein ACSQ67_025824 [Phaseolus vulgaris]
MLHDQGRYDIMRNYMPKVGSLGLDMMFRTCTVQVMRSIRDNITEEDLLNEISEIIRLPMYADRIRNDSKANQHANVARQVVAVSAAVLSWYGSNSDLNPFPKIAKAALVPDTSYIAKPAVLRLCSSNAMLFLFKKRLGLAFLPNTETKVIYRDFKTSNILLDTNYNAKPSDFGLARDGPTGYKSHVSTRVMGTHGYAAPEYLATGDLTPVLL